MNKIHSKRLLKLINDFRGASVLVAGDIILDQYIWGKVRRISPEAPVPVVEVERMTYGLGGAANVAAGVVALGGKAELVGVIGDGLYSKELIKLVEESGISPSGIVQHKGRPTTLKTRIIAHGQQVVRYDHEVKDEPTPTDMKTMTSFIESRMKNIDAIVLSDYDKGMLRGSLGPAVIRMAKRNKVIVTVDPKVPNMSRFKGADIITPNQSEAEQATGISISSEALLEKAGRVFLKKFKPNALLITRGEAGMSLFLPGCETFHVPAVARQVFDVTGAGDTAIATFTLALAARANPLEATWLANAAASVTVGKIGAATVSPDELTDALKREFK